MVERGISPAFPLMSVSISRPFCTVPAHSYTQSEILNWMLSVSEAKEKEGRLLKALYRETGIQHRHSVLDSFRAGNPSAETWNNWSSSDRMKVYRKEALELGKNAVKGLFEEQPDFQKPSHLIWVSCTGLIAPGPEILLSLSLGLKPDTQRMAVNFMGCHGFFHALRLARGIVALDPAARVVVVCVELCTLHFRPAQNEDQLLANALFGDGAAAVGIKAATPESALVCQEQVQFLEPQGLDSMAWDLGEAGFAMKLARSLPNLLEEKIQEALSLFASSSGAFDPVHFVIHPGGKRILDSVQRSLALPESALRSSRKALSDVGNVSSAAVLFALRNFLDLKPGSGEGLLLGVGPGITIEAARFFVPPSP